MGNKELVAIKEKKKTEHKKRVESIKQNGSWQSFDELRPSQEVNEETYFEVFKLKEKRV